MIISSELLKERLNNQSIIDWIDNDKSPASYKQGFLSGLIKALAIVGEVEYFTKHGCDRPSIELDLDDEKKEGLKIIVGAISDKLNELELTSHSEKDIVGGCIALMEDVHSRMSEYMEMMGFEYNDDEMPIFQYSYFEIVQKLLLSRTRHGGGTSTRKKCEQLGLDSYETVIIGESEGEKIV